MKVHELITLLGKFDGWKEVVVQGYEGGTNPLSQESIVEGYVDTEAGADYYGDYGDLEDAPQNMKNPIRVVLLGR